MCVRVYVHVYLLTQKWPISAQYWSCSERYINVQHSCPCICTYVCIPCLHCHWGSTVCKMKCNIPWPPPLRTPTYAVYRWLFLIENQYYQESCLCSSQEHYILFWILLCKFQAPVYVRVYRRVRPSLVGQPLFLRKCKTKLDSVLGNAFLSLSMHVRSNTSCTVFLSILTLFVHC